jgi:hypothetical protein
MLNELQRPLARLTSSLAQTGDVALAGGGALLGASGQRRPTRDVHLLALSANDIDVLTSLVSEIEVR